jgi:tRNA pseudouridine38-40 synthase
LEYHGRGFVGWQMQPGQRSIQGVVQDAVASLVGHRAQVAASGRTDAGVHAHAQVASFETTAERSVRSVRDGLTSLLPDDVSCVSAEVVPLAFDARRWVRRKTYRYTWLDRRSRSPFSADRAWHVRSRLDEVAMRAAIQCLQGRHDFSSFRAVGCAARHPVRVIEAVDVRRLGDFVELEVVGNGFLRHMIRIVAGTLFDIGRARQPVAWMSDVLAAADRKAAGGTAPACGLALVSVEYEDGPRR